MRRRCPLTVITRIDSLCIIQDDNDDWMVEAEKMSEIYRNATVTLSADGAENAAGGLFGDASVRLAAQQAFRILTPGPGGEQATIYARKRLSLPSDPNTAPHSSSGPRESKLSRRGWVAQERILSPRMVHFYKEELVWSCYGLQRCECRLMGGAPTSGEFRHLLTKGSDLDLLLEWPKVVQQYTSKELTFAKDRLPAISGLAKLIQQHTKSRYLAGLWAQDMSYSLLWMSDHAQAKKPVQRIPAEPYAPSWSWASIDGPVRYIDRHLDQFNHRRSGKDEIDTVLKTAKAATYPQTSNKYGPTKVGFVTVSGQVLPIRYVPNLKAWRPDRVPPSAGSDSWSEVDHESTEFSGSLWYTPRVEPKIIYDVLDDKLELESEEGGQVLFLVRAGTYIWGGTMSTQGTEVVALLLMYAGDVNGTSLFKRAGIALQAFDSQKIWKDIPTQNVLVC